MTFLSEINLLDPQIKVFLVAILGLLSGSFVTLFTYRINNGKSIIFARSECPHCQKSLKIYNLVPIFSWIIQRGKCSFCHIKISARYPLIELVFLGLFLLTYFTLGQVIDIRTIIYLLITATLIAMCIADLEYYFIPNSSQYFLATLVAILLIIDNGSNGAFVNIMSAFLYLGFGIVLWAFFYVITKVEAIGIDDLKFFFIAGLMLGIDNFLNFMFLSGVLGLVFGVIWQKITKEKTFPFAPALCASAYVWLLFNKTINPIDILGSLLFFQSF